MKIYKYYAGKVHSLEVRETEKMYISEKYVGLAFDCGKRFLKSQHWPTSRLEAIREAINIKVSFNATLEEKIQKNKSELSKLWEMEATEMMKEAKNY